MTTKQNFGDNVWLDGQIVPTDEAQISVMSHALHYGSSAYEGIRIYGYKPFKLDEHLERLFYSAKVIGLEIKTSPSDVKKACLELIKINNVENGYMRPLVWRGKGENMVIGGSSCPIHLLISAWSSFEDKRKEFRKNGLRLCISSWRKPPKESSPCAAKVASIYTISTMVKNEAESMGFDDAIMLDMHGNLTEISTSNIFFIKNRELITPLADCFLNGITRQTIIKEVAPNLGAYTREMLMHLKDIENFDSAFVSGTAAEIVPISSIHYEGKVKEFNIDHDLLKELMVSFHKLASMGKS